MRIEWRGRHVKAQLADSVEQALRDAGEVLLEEANQKVPFEEGNLARSGFVDVEPTSATVSYDTPYAARLHENPQYHFQHGRRGKWLQLALQDQAQRLEQFLADRLKGVFR